MLELISLSMDSTTISGYGTAEDIERAVSEMGCDGLEIIWGGKEFPKKIPCAGALGYHLLFYPDWVDFWHEDTGRLIKKMGSLDTVEKLYGGLTRDSLIRQYLEDMDRAQLAGARYVVFHVSDVSLEEGYTYKWEHSDKEVIDAAAELINTLIGRKDYNFEILLENQWWPGFSFTKPEMTQYLLDSVDSPRKGIMLDTGHLMNANTSLRTQREGVDYIHRMLDIHGELSGFIRGFHFHYSLSGEYVEKHTGRLPEWVSDDYFDRFGQNYSHILKIDTHRPWTDPAAAELIDRVRPAYLTHELSAKDAAARRDAVLTQRRTIAEGKRG